MRVVMANIMMQRKEEEEKVALMSQVVAFEVRVFFEGEQHLMR